MSDFSIEIINSQTKLTGLIDHLASLPVIALDIETVNWWNRHQERIALIQFAFRSERKPKVVIRTSGREAAKLPHKPYFFRPIISVLHLHSGSYVLFSSSNHKFG